MYMYINGNNYYMLACEFCMYTAWDLLQINVFGFKGLVEWFSAAYPGYFISPLRIAGTYTTPPTVSIK